MALRAIWQFTTGQSKLEWYIARSEASEPLVTLVLSVY